MPTLAVRLTVKSSDAEPKKVMFALSVSKNHNPRYVKMVSVPNLKRITVGKLVEKCVARGSIIESDNASSYKKPLAVKYSTISKHTILAI